jgi:hypothetical protein
LVFEKKRQFFRRKLSKIAENFDHNIDPKSGIKVKLLQQKGGDQVLLDLEMQRPEAHS